MLCMLLTQDTALPPIERIQKELSVWSDLPLVKDIEKSPSHYTFTLDETRCMIGLIPVPIPPQELELPCKTSLLWPDASAEVPKASAHMVINVFEEEKKIYSCMLLTVLATAVMAASPTATGVYWGCAPQLIRKDEFTKSAKKLVPHTPPVHLWVASRVAKDAGGTSSGFTQGLRTFDLMEIEAFRCPESPSDLHDRFMSIARYLMQEGTTIKHGDTFGYSASEKIKILHAQSHWGYKDEVMRLDYSQYSKPWWRFW